MNAIFRNTKEITYGKLERRGKRWIMSEVPPHVALRLKAVFREISKTQTGSFAFHYTEEVCEDLVWFMERYPMEMSQEDRQDVYAGRALFRRSRAEIEEILLPEWKAPPISGFKPGFTLWPIQAQAIEVGRRRGRLVLGDPVGQGKTFTALGMGMNSLPMAVCAKTHLPAQWVKQFIEPYTYLSSHIIKGTVPYSLPRADVYLFRYSNIAGWSDVAAKGYFQTFICDEVHELRHGQNTEKGRAAKVFADNAKLKLGMSATPIFNYGDEIHNIMEIFDPGVLGTREEFLREWCKSSNGKWIVEDPQALGTYLREMQAFIRRDRDGRPVNIQIIEVPYDHDVEKEVIDLAKVLAVRTLRGSFTESGQAARELDALVRQATGIAKARGVAAFCKILLSQKIPIILGGWHRAVYDIWRRDLAEFNPVMFTGSETPKIKEKSKQAFISGDTDCLIMSLRSGDGTDGLQKRCKTIVFGEYDWSPQTHAQFIGRIDRFGQAADELDAFYCHAEEGSDPTIVSVHGLKGSQARGIVDPFAGVEVVHRNEQRVKELARNFLERHGGA